MNGLDLALRHEKQKVNRIGMTSEENGELSSREGVAQKFRFRFLQLSSGGFLNLHPAARGLLATDHVILSHGQVTWTTPELAPPLLTTTPHQREDISALDRFSVHRCPTRRVFSGTGLELVTKPATIRCLYHSATAAYAVVRMPIKKPLYKRLMPIKYVEA
ncbi:uncharacterized protein TNCV_1595911 [Trichonephila clavipes]|nr:uncharacterized protein TNCV_1595911 [Trichonephila clavipes]